MANVPYQSYSPSAPAPNTVIKTTQDSDGSQIQHVIVESAYPTTTTRSDDFYNDAFQRLRVSAPDTRFDNEFLYDKQPLLFEEIKGGAGSATHNAAMRDVVLANGGTALADGAGMFQRFDNIYTPGNSQFVALTGTLNGGNLAGTAAVFLRSSVTGSTQEQVINQADWIGASSGVNWQYSQIFLMDFQSLKIGRVRFALDRAGLAVTVAVIENDNIRAGGYWQLANNPIYWKIYNTATATVTEFGYGDANNAIGFRFTSALASQTARAICATVKSEGGGSLLDMPGFQFSAANGVTTKTVSNTLIPVLSIQIQPTFGGYDLHGVTIPTDLQLYTDNSIFYQVLINPTLTNASFGQVNANSHTFVDVAANAISGGRVIYSGYATTAVRTASATGTGFTSKVPISVNYAGTVGDILTIAAIRMSTTNAAVGAAIEWKEIR